MGWAGRQPLPTASPVSAAEFVQVCQTPCVLGGAVAAE